MRKAQVTIFIILGIIIVIVFLIFFSLQQTLTAEQRRVVSLAKTQLESPAVNLYITSCLEKSFEEGIVKLANNGLWIYEVAGCDADNCTLAGNINNASYGLTFHPEIEGVPKYPCIDTSYTWPFCKFYYNISRPVLSVYGKIGMPKLEEGPNSIKDQIERYIEEKVIECIDFNRIQAIAGQPYDVNIKDSDVSFEIRAEDVRVELNLPVSINYQGKTITEIKKFTVDKRIRLNHIYKFVYELLFKDNTDLGFDIATDFSDLTWYFGGMRFNISYNERGFDDLIIIKDNESRINDKPLEFKFARQNLPPVLNYLSGFSTSQYDYVVLENQTLIIEPGIFDPNEDNLVVSYAGWKSNYDEIFTPEGIDRFNLITPILQRDDDKAIIELTKFDLGPHNLTVFVTDGQHTDYQVVRILVDDKVSLEISGSNPYPEIPDGFASIEDPYFFQATTTDFFNPGENTYFWEDFTEQKVLYTGNEESFWIPGPENNSILFYEGVKIDKVQNPFNDFPAEHEIRARVVSTSIGDIENEDSKKMFVQVRQCLPHRSNIPPYPYNEIDNPHDNYTLTSPDPFMGSHTCCIGESHEEWRVAGPETVCYERKQYGVFSLLAEWPYPNNGDANDVYVKVFERMCDGTRGNMCLGNESETIKVYQRCSNEFAPNYCQGPAVTSSITAAPIGCANYTGVSLSGKACNEQLKCSNAVSYGAQGNLLCKGGCDGAGGCTLPYQCVDAKTDPSHKACYRQGDAFFTRECKCENNEIVCPIKDLDDGKEWCDVCADEVIWLENMCCGDDVDEFLVENNCCDDEDDCVINGICYDEHTCIGDDICIDNEWMSQSDYAFSFWYC